MYFSNEFSRMMRTFCLALILFVSFFYFSCETSVESKIDGTWRMVNVSDMSSDKIREWTLLSGYIYMTETQTGSSSHDTLCHGVYNIKIKRLKRYLCLSDCSNSYYNGDYRINKLNNKYLVIAGDVMTGQYFEFTKK